MKPDMYFKVKNIEKFQHYKKKNPAWIKLQYETLHDYNYTMLPDASRSHLLGIWLLASRSIEITNKGKVIFKPLAFNSEWIKNAIHATENVNLDILVEAGFLIKVNELGETLDKVYRKSRETLEKPYNNPIPETETETETEEEKSSDLLHKSEAKPLVYEDEIHREDPKSIGEIVSKSKKPEPGTFAYWMGYVRKRFGAKLSKDAYQWAGKLWKEKLGADKQQGEGWNLMRQKVELLICFVFDEFIEEGREFSFKAANAKLIKPTLLEDAGRSGKRKAQEEAGAKIIQGGFRE